MKTKNPVCQRVLAVVTAVCMILAMLSIAVMSVSADSGSTVEALSYPLAITGGAEMEATALKAEIAKIADYVPVTGDTVCYVSPNGSGNNSGSSPENAMPFATLMTKVNAGGSFWDRIFDIDSYDVNFNTILLKRGEVYRTQDGIRLKSGMNLGAYGEGAKPQILGSVENHTGWTATSTENVYELSYNGADVGIILINGSMPGNKCDSLDALSADNDFYHDSTANKLYLYSTQNPGAYDSVEIGSDGVLVYVVEDKTDLDTVAENVNIINLDLRYSGGHAININNSDGVTVKGCEISWIGGSMHMAGSRYGNAIQFWDSASNVTAEYNYTTQIYDAGISPQGSGNFANIEIKNNLVEYTTMAIEYWDSDSSDENDTHGFNNLEIENNILRFSGYGWGSYNTSAGRMGHINGGYLPTTTDYTTSSITISGNIFDCAYNSIFRIPTNTAPTGYTISGNTYYQMSRQGNGDFGLGVFDKDLAFCYGDINTANFFSFAANQAELENAVVAIDSAPSRVKWLNGPDDDGVDGYMVSATSTDNSYPAISIPLTVESGESYEFSVDTTSSAWNLANNNVMVAQSNNSSNLATDYTKASVKLADGKYRLTLGFTAPNDGKVYIKLINNFNGSGITFGNFSLYKNGEHTNLFDNDFANKLSGWIIGSVTNNSSTVSSITSGNLTVKLLAYDSGTFTGENADAPVAKMIYAKEGTNNDAYFPIYIPVDVESGASYYLSFYMKGSYESGNLTNDNVKIYQNIGSGKIADVDQVASGGGNLSNTNGLVVFNFTAPANTSRVYIRLNNKYKNGAYIGNFVLYKNGDNTVNLFDNSFAQGLNGFAINNSANNISSESFGVKVSYVGAMSLQNYNATTMGNPAPQIQGADAYMVKVKATADASGPAICIPLNVEAGKTYIFTFNSTSRVLTTNGNNTMVCWNGIGSKRFTSDDKNTKNLKSGVTFDYNEETGLNTAIFTVPTSGEMSGWNGSKVWICMANDYYNNGAGVYLGNFKLTESGEDENLFDTSFTNKFLNWGLKNYTYNSGNSDSSNISYTENNTTAYLMVYNDELFSKEEPVPGDYIVKLWTSNGYNSICIPLTVEQGKTYTFSFKSDAQVMTTNTSNTKVCWNGPWSKGFTDGSNFSYVNGKNTATFTVPTAEYMNTVTDATWKGKVWVILNQNYYNNGQGIYMDDFELKEEGTTENLFDTGFTNRLGGWVIASNIATAANGDMTLTGINNNITLSAELLPDDFRFDDSIVKAVKLRKVGRTARIYFENAEELELEKGDYTFQFYAETIGQDLYPEIWFHIPADYPEPGRGNYWNSLHDGFADNHAFFENISTTKSADGLVTYKFSVVADSVKCKLRVVSWADLGQTLTVFEPRLYADGNNTYNILSGSDSRIENWKTAVVGDSNTKFEKSYITKYTIKLGDVNGDNSVDLLDLVRMKKRLAGVSVAEFLMYNADIDVDGKILATDLVELRKILLSIN